MEKGNVREGGDVPMKELRDLLDQLDVLTKALSATMRPNRWAELSREERMETTQRLRECCLRMGNVLEEGNADE